MRYIIILIGLLVLLVGCEKSDEIDMIVSYEECVAEGLPVYEGDPIYCISPEGLNFTESFSYLTYEEALDLAKRSDCPEFGTISGDYLYMDFAHKWIFSLETDAPGCMPVCIVYGENSSVDVQWKCLETNFTAPITKGTTVSS